MPHQPRSDETHARILAAAAEYFGRGGYDATGVAEICTRAGVSKGAFYHHFPSKQAVFLALIEQWLQGVDVPVRATRAAGETVQQQLAGLAQIVEPVFALAQGQIPMFLEFWRQAAKDPEVWQATIELSITHIFARAAESIRLLAILSKQGAVSFGRQIANRRSILGA